MIVFHLFSSVTMKTSVLQFSLSHYSIALITSARKKSMCNYVTFNFYQICSVNLLKSYKLNLTLTVCWFVQSRGHSLQMDESFVNFH